MGASTCRDHVIRLMPDQFPLFWVSVCILISSISAKYKQLAAEVTMQCIYLPPHLHAKFANRERGGMINCVGGCLFNAAGDEVLAFPHVDLGLYQGSCPGGLLSKGDCPSPTRPVKSRRRLESGLSRVLGSLVKRGCLPAHSLATNAFKAVSPRGAHVWQRE